MYSLTLQYEISYNTLCNFLHYTMSSLTLTYVIAYTTLCNLLHFTIQYLTLHHVLSDPSLHCIAMITLLCPVPGTPHYSYSYRGSSGCELRYAHSLCDNVRCAVHYELCIVQCTVLWCALFSVLCSVCAVARGLKMKSFWIHLASSNFTCVTQTKRLRPSELKLDDFFLRHTLKLFRWTFFHPISSPFMWIELEKKSRIVSGFWNFSCVTQN